jgi:ABC-type branched-subunit amino acid transport system permease subunit
MDQCPGRNQNQRSTIPGQVGLIDATLLFFISAATTDAVGLAIVQSQIVASSVGVNEAAFRVLDLAIGCFFAGLAGASTLITTWY